MIITLCGSARFESWFHLWNEVLGLSGHASFGLCAWPSMHEKREWYSSAQKAMLDRVHFDKIAASDAILVLNPFAYVGESTLNEIAEARRLSKAVYTLESWGISCGIGPGHFMSVQDAAKRLAVPRGFGSPFDARHDQRACRSVWDLLGPGGADRSALVNLINEFKRTHSGSAE